MDNTGNLYQLLETSAHRFPDATALEYNTTTSNYADLLAQTSKLQQQLSAAGILNEHRVAIYCRKSIEFVVSIFATLKNGSAYIPLDYIAPAERNLYIIKNAEVKALIIEKQFLPLFSEGFTVEKEIFPEIFLLTNTQNDLSPSPAQLAYILYTSGSTGHPKGVMHSHTAALEFINWSNRTFSAKQTDRFSSQAPFHFDLSIFDLFVSISNGASLVLIDEDSARQPLILARLISEKKISIWYSTPTILKMLASFGKMNKYDYSQLRIVLFAGEVFPVGQFTELKNHWFKAVYYNLYGPTETNVCTYYRVPDLIDMTTFPIGKVCEHYQYTIINTEPNGIGELCISGNGLMTGYWKVADKNNVFFSEKEQIFYRTGDLVLQNKEGNLIFKGRIDRMIKKNGYRIELGEIETVLHLNPAVLECAVIATQDENNPTAIHAFICSRSEEEKSFLKMKEYSLKHLPVYMIPDNFIFLSALPQTASNKIDYQKLKQLLP